MTPDVFVIGGGPAGLAAAISARRQGLRVTVADCSVAPIDKACGEGIMPDGIAAAARLGFQLDGGTGHPFRGIRFCQGQRSVAASFPHGTGLGMRRTDLHSMMAAHAAEAGVEMRWGARVSGITDKGVIVDGSLVPARWIVGADGGNSQVRRWAGLDACAHQSLRYGFRRHYHLAPRSEVMELHWGDGCQLYITPVSEREMCVVLISRNPRLRLDDALPQFPQVNAWLRSAGASTPERGGVSATRRLRAVCRGRVALIGDASGSVDAITGEGLCLLFQQAVALGNAFAADDLSRYAAEHRRIGRRPRFMADLMLALDRRTHLRSMVMNTLTSHPQLFERMLRFHVGKAA